MPTPKSVTPLPAGVPLNPLAPKFDSTVIEPNRTDGYWVETFHFSSKDPVPGVITSGLVSGVVEFLENPIAAEVYRSTKGNSNADIDIVKTEWKRYEIGKFDSPVAVTAVDVSGNGLMDLVICHDYGPYMLECDPAGGFITWLENPGRDSLDRGHWKERYIGRWPAMHRLKTGHFTQKSFLEIVAASVVYGPHDKATPIPIIRFQAPEKVFEATEWTRDIIDDQHFTVIHELTSKKFNGPSGLDSLLVSSREGTTWLYYDGDEWKRELIGIGEPRTPGQSETSELPGSGDHWGTGGADAGRVGGDPFAYIATLDPFHGTTCCVYTKVDRGIDGSSWKRRVLDVYGTPTQLKKNGDGPGHYIVCGDFDGDGDDEFLLSLFGSVDRDENGETLPTESGPNPNKGIMYYKALDLEKGIFAKWKIADESSARIALGDFGGKGRLDLISMSYNVHRYYEEPQPVVTLHTNEFAPSQPTHGAAIIPSIWANEGIVYLAPPTTVKKVETLSLIEVANYAAIVEIYPPKATIAAQKEEGIKVLYGSVIDTGKNEELKALGTQSFPDLIASTTCSSSLTAHETKGAIIIRFTPTADKPGVWAKAQDVPVKNTFNDSLEGLVLPPLTFVQVESLWWGSNFKGVDFYNLSGFHFRFASDLTPIAHLQFWTAGTNVNCGVHNHSDDIFEEVHICLSPGTETGGMSRMRDGIEGSTPPDKFNDLPASAFDHLVLNRLDEHAGMWYRDTYGRPVRRPDGVIAYPYHKWQAGSGSNVDVWAAFEFNPELDLF